MKNVCVLNDHSSSKQNGIGTFMRQLPGCLEGACKLHMIEFNDDVTFFEKTFADGVEYMHIPHFANGRFLVNSEISVTLLRLHIADSKDNVFIANYFPCNKLLNGIRKFFPRSKIVFVVHDQSWTARLMGNVRLFREIVSDD